MAILLLMNKIKYTYTDYIYTGGTNVSRVRVPDPASYVGWDCCWFSSLLREVFPQVLRFSPLLKNQHF